MLAWVQFFTTPVISSEFGMMTLARLEGLDLGRAHADAAHEAFVALHDDLVADADRPLGQQDQPGDEIRHDRLQPEADADRERAGDQRDLLRIDAELAQRQRRSRR